MYHRAMTGALAVVAVAGLAASASGGLTITPTDLITWGGVGQGRAVPSPSGFTWTWSNTAPTPMIGSDGRVWMAAQFNSNPAIGSISGSQGPRGLFTATNNTDIELFNGLHDGASLGGGVTLGQQNSTGVFNLTGLSTLRVSGTRIGLGVGMHGTGIVNTGATQNNSDYRLGTYAGGVSTAQARQQGISLIDVSGAAATGLQNVDFRGISQAHGINSSGAMAWGGSVTAAAGGAGGVGQFLTTTPTAAPFGNAGFVATRDAGGATTVIAQAGQTAPGGGIYGNGGTNGVRGFNVRTNRSGQVYYDATMVVTGAVNASNDSRAFIYTPGVGSQRIYREGFAAPDTTGTADAGGALFSGAQGLSFRSFSDAGLLMTGSLTSGDVSTSNPLTDNSQGTYIANTSGTTRLVRRNDVLPGLTAADNVRLAATNSASLSMNNTGFVAFAAGLQGENVIISRNTQLDFGNPQRVVEPGRIGNDAAIIAGTAGNLRTILRDGDNAPGLPGSFTVEFSSGSITPVLNNLNQILFTVETSPLAVGTQVGTVGQLASELGNRFGPRVLYGWALDFGLVPLLYEGQQVEVETGVFKTLQSWVISNQESGDGGGLGFSDTGKFAVQLKFTDESWGVAALQVPAPGAGAAGLMGLALLARRRRR